MNKKIIISLCITVLLIILSPILISPIKDYQLKRTWKSTYINLSKVTEQMVKENKKSLKGICDTTSTQNNSICIKNEYLKYLEEQGKSIEYKSLPKYTYLNGKSFSNSDKFTQELGASTVLKNGIILTFYRQDFINGQIWVDVNGVKGPNRVGKDYFRLWLYPIYISPTGGPTDTFIYTNRHTCKSSGYGWGCSFKYLKQMRVKNLK